MDNRKYVFLYNGRGWFLMIDSLDVLNDYMDIIWNIRYVDLLDALKRIKENKHPVGDIMYMCETLAKAKGTNIWQEYEALRKKQFEDMTHMVLKGETLYVNTSGGYTISLENVTNRYESGDLRWPVFNEDDIRIKKWPGGIHYYAYIGPIQVKDGETLKWDSEEEAKAAAMSYVTKTQKRLK